MHLNQFRDALPMLDVWLWRILRYCVSTALHLHFLFLFNDAPQLKAALSTYAGPVKEEKVTVTRLRLYRNTNTVMTHTSYILYYQCYCTKDVIVCIKLKFNQLMISKIYLSIYLSNQWTDRQRRDVSVGLCMSILLYNVFKELRFI